MSRVINIDNPTKKRNQNRRTIAELLRRLSQKAKIDEEVKDMAATIVFALREISKGVEQTVIAWEKRDYWIKAERFVRQWEWVVESAANLEDVIRNDAWDLLPELLADLFPRFSDIQIKTMTRKRDVWHGAYDRLISEPPGELPW
ncbi:MAG: hypothetical protein R3293_08015 [Candidatus Promineifilaceae bacterium]|nr:hypothetical protein [Candidatus Promineifilaceae bacterium]